MTRVVVTGLGVVAPNATGRIAFAAALRAGKSGVRLVPELGELGFTCRVAGVPQLGSLPDDLFSEDQRLRINSVITLATLAAVECWRDGGFDVADPDQDLVDWDTGLVVGTGMGGIDTVADVLVPKTNAGQLRRLGSTVAERSMFSGAAAFVAGYLGLGGPTLAVSTACSSGTEAVISGFYAIRDGRAKRVLAGGAEGVSFHVWAMFDGMRVLARNRAFPPEQVSRPMSVAASGFVPAGGAGFLLLESLESALERGAKIYAEIGGCASNSGGQRQGGTMTAPSPVGVQRCIREAISRSGIEASEVDVISGHLTATAADPLGLLNWQHALGRRPQDFPLINAPKSMIGHALGAAGAIECVASVLQIAEGFVHGSINCEDLHPEFEVFAERIPRESIDFDVQVIAKASFGFGDVNACVVFRRWDR